MGAACGFGLVFCHGAHTREEQEHADEDINSNIIFNKDIKAGHDRTGQGSTHKQDTPGITSRPDNIKLNRHELIYTGKS